MDMTIISALITGFIVGYTVALIIGVAIIKQFEIEAKENKRKYLDLAIAISHPIPDVDEYLKIFGYPVVFVDKLDIDKNEHK